MDGPRTFWPSDSILPGPSIIKDNKSVINNDQLKYNGLSVSIQLKKSVEVKILYRKDSKAQGTRSFIA